MVQRKVPKKIGIQADHVKFEKRLASLKTSSSQFQEGRHRGAELKKKMKKSRSVKLSDIESLRSSPLRKNISQPGKPPPPLNAPTVAAAAFPQKPPLTKTTYGSPNYMKPTSCSDARKEQSQVSLRNSPAIVISDSKNQHERSSSNSKVSSASNHKPERTSTRTGGLKLVRNLIKSPSFKPARASAKKSSRVALCAGMNAQRETCSSTLKDTKFPDYLVISPGGTEAEGTSVMKVCPYTYCSLNGHHHSPAPPLKSFLSARRRSLKTQKMMKLQALSPRQAKQSNSGIKEIDFQQMMFDGNDKSAEKEAALNNLLMAPMKHGVGIDFFIEIYAASKEDEAEAIGGKAGADFLGEQDDYNHSVFPNDAFHEAATKNHANNLLEEHLSDRPPQFESDSEAEIFKDITENDQKGVAVEDYGPLSDQEETSMGSCSNESDREDLSSIEVDYASSETTDMEWEEGQFSTSVLDEDESGPNGGCSAKIQDSDMHQEPLIKPDAIDNNSTNIIQDYCEVLLQGLPEERQLNEGGVREKDGTKQNYEIQESGPVYERLNYDQLSYSEDAFERDSELSETDCIEMPSSSVEEPIEELTKNGEESQERSGVFEAEDREIDSHLGDVESNSTSAEKDEASETSTFTSNQASIVPQDSSETDDAETKEGCNRSLDEVNSETSQNVATNEFGLEQELPMGVSRNQMKETEKVDDTKSLAETRLSDLAHATSEADEDAINVDEGHEKCTKTETFQLNESAEDGNSGQDFVAESIFFETNGNLFDGKYKNPKISSPIESEDQSDVRLKKAGLSENSTGEPENMEVENNSEADATEAFITANNSINPGLKRKFSRAENNSNQEFPNTCNYRKGIKCKRLSLDEEEQGKFNPREPNYLPLVPDPEAEKVDLRHQMMDEKKNAEEWMLDFALQQAVTKLAPARKKKVALLVEAFETVMPVPKFETRLRHTPAAFNHARPMQSCR